MFIKAKKTILKIILKPICIENGNAYDKSVIQLSMRAGNMLFMMKYNGRLSIINVNFMPLLE
jgi:hypothetical protein